MTTAPNAELAWQVIDHIDAHPESWYQGTWWCGTGGCFAGWAVTLSGAVIDFDFGTPIVVHAPDPALIDLKVGSAAYTVLGIDHDTAHVLDGDDREDWLFSACNDRADLGRLVEAIFGPRPGGAA